MTHRHHAAALYLFLTLLLFLSTLHAHATTFEDYHTFTDVSGRKITAKVLSCNQDTGAVNLRLRNGKMGVISEEQLSPADRNYLELWKAAAPFLSNELLEINITVTEGKWDYSGGSNKDHKKKPGTYSIALSNHGQTTLTNLYVEYCEYREKRSRNAPNKYISTYSMSIEIGELDSGRTFDANRKYNSYRVGSTFLNEVVGARFRFMMPLPDGTLCMREVCLPEPLPLEEYPWQLSERALALEKASLPEPADYPDKELSEQDIEAIVEQYIQAWAENDFEAWKAMMSPMHPGSSKLNRSRFQSLEAQTKRIKILAIDGRNVKVQTTSQNDTHSAGWIQLHSSGHIKYTPMVFTHPVHTALACLPQLVSEHFRHSGSQHIRETKVPLFDYKVGGDMDNWDENTKKTLDWLRQHGASHDVSEPFIFLPQEKLDEMIEGAERNLEFTKML